MAKAGLPKIPRPVAHKMIFQARYKPELKFYDLFRTAAQQLEEYPHWQTSGLDITLYDFDKRCSAGIDHNAFSYTQDSGDAELEEKNLRRVLECVPSVLQLKSFTRLGYRKQYLIAVNISFESLVSILNVKLLSQDDTLRRILPSRFDDLLYRVDASESPYRYRLLIGPVRRREVPKYLVYDQEHHLAPEVREEKYIEIINNYPEVSVFLDFDFFRAADILEVSEISPFVGEARQRVDKLANELSGYLFGRDIES